MASLKDLKMKIVGVKKTKQITKAMNMVASAKLRGAQSKIEMFRPYASKFQQMLTELSSKVEGAAHPLLAQHEEKKTCVIILATSDRGLCGSFNSNLISTALKLAKKQTIEGMQVKFICAGKKGKDSIAKSEYEMIAAFHDRMSNLDYSLANAIGLDVISGFGDLVMDEVYLIYGEFVSLARQKPTTQKLLPLETIAVEEKQEDVQGKSGSEYIYEPEEEALLAEILPRYVKVQIYRGLLDTSCSEHAARMSAMGNATQNCDEMSRLLTLLYNKTRQAAITSDLMDIVGGAEALNG